MPSKKLYRHHEQQVIFFFDTKMKLIMNSKQQSDRAGIPRDNLVSYTQELDCVKDQKKRKEI